MSKITIVDLEVWCCVGVSDEERAKPQRLLISVDMKYDFSSAAISDRIEKTIDYYQVAQDILRFGHGRNWKLLEKLAANLADALLKSYPMETITIEIKKFVIPQASYVSVGLTRNRRR